MVLCAPISAATAEVVRLKEALLLVEESDTDPNKVASRAAQMVGRVEVDMYCYPL